MGHQFLIFVYYKVREKIYSQIIKIHCKNNFTKGPIDACINFRYGFRNSLKFNGSKCH